MIDERGLFGTVIGVEDTLQIENTLKNNKKLIDNEKSSNIIGNSYIV